MCCTLSDPTQLAATDAMMIVSKTLEAGGAMSSHHASGQEAHGQFGLLRVAPEAPDESVSSSTSRRALFQLFAVGPPKG